MFLVNSLQSRKLKTHDFRNLESNVDYFVDFQESGRIATLTTAHYIKRDEKIVLLFQEKPITYVVKDFQTYWNSEIQTILLKRVGETAS